ncbi:MAG TPA: hypothetical protein VFT26_02285 [Pyrinomonadaceae bacterium]|nr:hypothetical protein [Pyrinomonadaceae bacterium]
MKLGEMTSEMITNLQYFNEQLKQAGWEITDFAEMLSAGMSVSPEAMARREKATVTLEAHLDLGENEIRLFILDRQTDQLVRLALSFGENLKQILSCLIDEQDRMNTKTFPDFLIRSSKFVTQAWFVDHEGTRFPLDIPDNANS